MWSAFTCEILKHASSLFAVDVLFLLFGGLLSIHRWAVLGSWVSTYVRTCTSGLVKIRVYVCVGSWEKEKKGR